MSNVRIENWAVVAKRGESDMSGPSKIHLRGVVSGHPSYPDGSEITTSLIVHRHGNSFVTSNGTHYELGTVHPDYGAQFPNADLGLYQRFPEKYEDETLIVARTTQPSR
jgi:hypothetical protein